jgi:hypothetical protein
MDSYLPGGKKVREDVFTLVEVSGGGFCIVVESLFSIA